MKVIFHGNATLPCSVTCSGLVTWARSNDDVVAQCNQTSCQPMKAGYRMIYDQYLKGDLSLYITDADFSMRDTYTCQCNRTALSDVELIITGKSVHLFSSWTVSDRTPVIHMQCFIPN